ncbi:unnamed protein product [Moneuplotes crassus]|uniref:Uncharacterized protein n=1 Tax=Euplotes crassus TaxID=5936 RepID=A0AAD1TYW9_EUPCR|nr:unnamed protein product [Moneuplotes crassus]
MDQQNPMNLKKIISGFRPRAGLETSPRKNQEITLNLDNQSSSQLASPLNQDYISGQLNQIKKKMYYDIEKEESVDFLTYMNRMYKMSRKKDHERRKIFIRNKTSGLNKTQNHHATGSLTRLAKQKDMIKQKKIGILRRKAYHGVQNLSNLTKVIQRNHENASENKPKCS